MAKSSGSAIRAGRAFVELFADDTLLIRGLKRAEARVRRFGKNIHDIGRRLATIGLAMSVPFIMSTKTFADFDDTMRAVKAVSQATGEEFEMLTKKAIFLGRTTSFTAQQVADAMLMIGRAGFAPKEIDDSIKSILDLSRATKTDLSESARIASASLRAFNMDASDMPRVCDVMTAAANTSAQTLEDLGFSMSYCAPIAQQYGMTIEETCKAIGALSNYGIKASQAGTTFRRVLVNLADKRVQRRLKGLGVEITDKDTGKMRNASAILKDLGKSMRFMSESKQISLSKELFGVWAMAGSAKLTIADFDRLYDAIDNCGNIARDTATEMDAGIGGRLRILWSEIEAVRIVIGESLAPALIDLANYWIHAIGGMVQYIQKNKEFVVQTVKIIAQIVGVGAALMGTSFILLTVAKVASVAIGILATVVNVLLLPYNLIVKLANAVLFAGAAMINVFSAIGVAVYQAGSFLIQFAMTFYAATNMIGNVLIAVVSLTARALALIATGTAMALMTVLRATAMIVSFIVPLIGSILSGVMALLAPFVSAVAAFVGGMAASLAAYFTPLVSTTLWALSLIGAAISGAFFSITNVIRASFAQVGATIITTLSSVLSYLWGMMAAFYARMTAILSAFFARMAAMVGSYFAATTAQAGRALVVTTAQTSRAIALTTAQAGRAIALTSAQAGQAILVASGQAGRAVALATAQAGRVIVTTTAQATAAIGQMAWTLAARLAYLVGMIGVYVAQAIASVGAAITGLLLSMSPWLVVLLTLAAVGGAVYLLVRNIESISAAFETAFGAVVGTIRSVINWIGSVILKVLGFLVRPILAVFRWIIVGIWSIIKGIGSLIGSAIGSVVSTIRDAFAYAWSGVVEMFASVLGAIMQIVAAFGNYFMEVFDGIGEIFQWFKGQIGEVFGFFKEAYGAIVTALGRGDFEAAMGVVWAGLKLIWVKGTHVLLETWYWLTDTLQTAWATCVYKISELLLTAWYGVQQFWTETVYTMQTLWTGMIDALIGAWQYAEKLIKKGVGYIKALWQGTDPKEVLTGIDEEYDKKAKQREAERIKKFNEIQKNRDSRFGSLEADKQGAIGSLKSDLEASAARRKEANKAKTAGFDQEYADAKKAYDEAIKRANTDPEKEYSPWSMDGRKPNYLADLQNSVNAFKGMGGLSGLLGDKGKTSGTFNAFEVGSLNDSIAEEQLDELRNQTAMLRNLKFKGIPWKED